MNILQNYEEFDTQENLLSLHFGRTFWLNEEENFVQHQLIRMEKPIGKDGIMYPIGIWKESTLINSLMFIEL